MTLTAPPRGGFFGSATRHGRRPEVEARAGSVGATRLAPGSALYVPAGWPDAVRPPGAPDWEASAVAFLLDCCPHDYRAYQVLRKHPVVLARFAAEFVESQVRACRTGIGGVRASLDDMVPPEAVADATEAWLEQEAALKRRRREVALVEEALRGKVFIRKL